jgi:sterol desaturase/sphingolipid hydroxylase (fatty acid hydroxylase superfamily)
MDQSYIHLAIPVFFLLIGVEMLAARFLERDVYRLSDSVSDLSCGILQQVVDVFLKSALFAGYAWLFANERRFEIPAGAAWAWAACFLGVDFLYYWFHRWSHEVNAGWAAHVVHHQSEEYNLTVALRQGAFQQAFSWVFYLPLAVLGFPPVMFLAVSSFNTLYQFWIHTRLIGRLGPLEWVFNTPSHHRVHHARNPKYIDRNLGGTLIVWDRLFGTFGRERDEPVYGITRPLASWSPLWANLHYWAEMWALARRTPRPLDRLRVLWKRPGWRPDELGGPVAPGEVDRETCVKYDVPVPRGSRLYVLGHFVGVNLGTVAFLYGSGRLAPAAQATVALAIAWSLASFGGLLERRPWAPGLEAARLVAAGLALPFLPLPPWAVAGGLVLVAASLVWVGIRREKPLPLPAEVR